MGIEKETGIELKGYKASRVLNMYEELNKSKYLNKDELARKFHVSLKTVERDINDLRAYLSETHSEDFNASIEFDRSKNGYYLKKVVREWITKEEVLALCKISLASRAFTKTELNVLLEKLTSQVLPEDKELVKNIIKSENSHYVPPIHGKDILKRIWELSKYVSNKNIISFDYTRQDDTTKSYIVKPVAIMFSEYYFYLVSLRDDREYPTNFRIDRIKDVVDTGNTFVELYRSRFSEGDFRKHVQFMYSGEHKRVTFEFTGPSLEAILDRLPTAEVISRKGGVNTISVETYGDGILMWLKSQGDWVKIIN